MRTPRPRLLLAAFILVALSWQPVCGADQETKKVYTLEESVKEALANNWAYKAKEEGVSRAQEVKKQARSEFLPKLGLDYRYTRLGEPGFIAGAGGAVVLSSGDFFQGVFKVRQPIFTGFVLSSTYRLAELGVDLSELDVELEKLNLALRVKEAYFNILGADRLVEVATSAVESIEANVNVARNFYEVGMNPINEVLRAEVELGNAKQNLIKFKNAARLSRSSFNTILVKPITSPVEVEDILTYEPETGDLDAYVAMALERRPEIRIIDVNLDQVDQQKRLARSGYYPQVALGYDYIKEGDTYAVDGSGGRNANSWQVTATATWTFWEWGKTRYSVREQDSAEKQLLATRKELEDQIRLQVQEAIFALEEAELNIPTTKKAVEQGEENLRVNEERYRAQVQTITEVLDAQTLLSQARVNYYQALYDHNLASFRLQRAMGSY